MAKKIKIVISGGGTGGHIYPGIAIANELKKIVPDVEITFVGVKNRIEAKIVPREGYPLKTIHVQYFSRKIGFKTLTFFFSLKIGFIQSMLFLLRYKPNVVIGTGGFVSGPVVYTASLLRIPTFIQEQNSYPGITTRLLAPKVKRIHLAFEEAIKYLHKVKDQSKFRITGNPIRMGGKKSERIIALEKFNLDKNKKTLLLFGGSQGAAALNNALLETLPQLSTDIQIIWQTGEPDFTELKSAVEKLNHKIYIQPFIYNMADAYCAADLAFCRAGAITIAELMQMAVPSILVPYPHAAEGHQEKNARVLVNANAAKMILQRELNPTALKATIERLIYDKEKLSDIKKNCEKFYFENAAKEIAKSVLELIT
jgi:UDP-N-acetylglucosamine--N-acetylmuramyl-(pentapeptide) pyrophosphoryl-undecaprenol N-acetylglucosamine transferase